MKRIIILLLLIWLGIDLLSQTIEKKLMVPWNTKDGIKTKLYHSGNYGLSAFEVLNDNEVAFLCDVEEKVKVYSIETNNLLYEFDIGHPAKDFTYDQDDHLFYIIGEEKVYVHCKDGGVQNAFKYNTSAMRTFVRLEAKNGNLYVIASIDKTYQLVKNDTILRPSEQLSHKIEGTLLNEDYVTENPIDKGSVTKFTIENNDTKTEYEVKQHERSNGIRPITKQGDVIVLVEYYKKRADDNYTIYRRFLFYSVSSRQVFHEMDIPRIYFTSLYGDIKVSNGKLYHLLTSPEHATLFEINAVPTKSGKDEKSGYPNEFDYEFHYNEDLKQKRTSDLENYNLKGGDGNKADVGMRSEVLSRARKYADIQWTASIDNVPERDPSLIGENYWILDEANSDYPNVHDYWIRVPSWIDFEGDLNKSMPYKWGGYTHYNNFNYLINNGTYDYWSYTTNSIIGDISGLGYYEDNFGKFPENMVLGIDCSGFVSRAWGFADNAKQGTSTFPTFTTQLDNYSDLKPGDIINDAGSHVRMVVEYKGVNEIDVVESTTGGENKVVYKTYREDQLGGYQPRAMPEWDGNEYDLVYSNLDLDVGDLKSNTLNGSLDIENLGEDYYISRDLRIAVYEKPSSSESDELGDFVTSILLTHDGDATIEGGESVSYDFNESFGTTVDAGIYIFVPEYQRSKGDGGFTWQQIPWEFYDMYPWLQQFPINALLIKGILYDRDHVPEPYSRVVATGTSGSSLKSTSSEQYEATTDASGHFLLAIPEGWSSARLEFPDTEHDPIDYNTSQGELAVYPDGYEYGENQDFYHSTVSEGFKVNGCDNPIVYFPHENEGFEITPLARDHFIFRTEIQTGITNLHTGACHDKGWQDFVALASFLPIYYRFYHEYILEFQECNKNGIPIAGGHSGSQKLKKITGCNSSSYEDKVYFSYNDSESAYLEREGMPLHPGKYYLITLADDDYGWTESQRIVYPVTPDKSLSGSISNNTTIAYGDITVQNATVNGNTVLKSGSKITLGQNTKVNSGFQAKVSNKMNNPGCSSNSLKSAVTDTYNRIDKDESNNSNNGKVILDPCHVKNSEVADRQDNLILDEALDNIEIEQEKPSYNNERPFIIYPNPSQGIFNIKSFKEDELILKTEVYTIAGEQIAKYDNISSHQFGIDISDQSEGVYLVKIFFKGNVEMNKIVLSD